MLTVDPKLRPSAMECTQHAWFKEMEGADGNKLAQDPEQQQKILQSLKQFKGQSELRRAALNIFVKMCQPKEYDEIA